MNGQKEDREHGTFRRRQLRHHRQNANFSTYQCNRHRQCIPKLGNDDDDHHHHQILITNVTDITAERPEAKQVAEEYLTQQEQSVYSSTALEKHDRVHKLHTLTETRTNATPEVPFFREWGWGWGE